MGARRIRREQVATDQAFSRRTNGMRKMKEGIRRDKRMIDLVKKGTLPYTPAIMSWLSSQLDKPSSKIAQTDRLLVEPACIADTAGAGGLARFALGPRRGESLAELLEFVLIGVIGVFLLQGGEVLFPGAFPVVGVRRGHQGCSPTKEGV